MLDPIPGCRTTDMEVNGRTVRVVECTTGPLIQHVTTATELIPGVPVVPPPPKFKYKEPKARINKQWNNKSHQTKAERDQKRKQAKASKKRNRR